VSRDHPWPLIAALIAGVVLAATGLWATDGSFKEGWACEPERIGYTIASAAEGGGSEDELAAVRSLLPLLAEDGEVPLARLQDAVDQRTGMSSFDPASGELRIDGLIVARISVSQLPDGTWASLNYEQCMKPPQ